MGNKLGNTTANVKPVKIGKHKVKIKWRRKWFRKTKRKEDTRNSNVFTHWPESKQPQDETNHSLSLKKVETACRDKNDSFTENGMQTFNMTFEEDGFTWKEEEDVFTRKEENVTTNGLEEQRADRIVVVCNDEHRTNNIIFDKSGDEDSEISKMLGTSMNSSISETLSSVQENPNPNPNPHLPETEQRNDGNENEIMGAKSLAEVNGGNVAPKSEANRDLNKPVYTILNGSGDHDLSLNERPDNSSHNNQMKSSTLPTFDNTDATKRSHHDRGYMTVAEFADSAQYYTLSRLQTKDKRLFLNFKSLPNLTDIKNTNLEYQNHYMKELVFPGRTESVSQSDIYSFTFETEENFQIMPEVKEGSGLGDDDPMNQMQELKVIEDSQTVTKNRHLFEIVADSQTTRRNMLYIKRSHIQSVTAQRNTFDRNIPARLSGITVSSTDSGRSSNVTDLSATKQKQLQQGYAKYLCKPDCMKCRAALIEYMVEVYEPLIIRQIKVIDILDFLPLIDKRFTEMLRSKHRQSPHEAMELLLRLKRKSDDPGKWQSFLDAIHNTEFIYIYMLLNAETEVQYDYSTAVLSLVKPEIKARMCLPEFLDKVFEKELLTEMEKDEAICLSSGIEKQTYILDRVDKHLPNWDNVFVEVLNESCMNDLADLFVLVSQKEAIFTESNATTKGKNKSKSVRRAIRNQRLQFIEKAHGPPGFTPQMKPVLYQEQIRIAENLNKTLSASKVQGIDRTKRYENKSRVDLANVDDGRKCYFCDKSFDESNKNPGSILQNILSEVTEFKYQQQALSDQVKDLTHGMNELRLCVNRLLISDAKKEAISLVQ